MLPLKPSNYRSLLIATAIASGLLISACATPASQPETAAAQGASTGGFSAITGGWDGTLTASCIGPLIAGRCNAVNNISFTVVESEASKLGGSYTCAYGNQTCLRQNTTGKIARVRLDNSRTTIWVTMPDATFCVFDGNIAGNRMGGGYSCSSGGALLEQGAWQTQKSF
jgi:hypothetical protein